MAFGCGHKLDRYVALRPAFQAEQRVPWTCPDCKEVEKAFKELRGVEIMALERVRQSPEYRERRVSDEE